jgi:hypothetical protein
LLFDVSKPSKNYWDRPTTASTLSSIARLAAAIASRVPTSPISRSLSVGPDDGDTLILQPVVLCMSFMVSHPFPMIMPTASEGTKIESLILSEPPP